MNSEAEHQQLIDAITDGIDIDWRTHKNKSMAAGFQALEKIQRINQNKAASKKNLFEWKHLSVRQHIGEGFYGDVFLAHDPVLDRLVALKLLKTDNQSLNKQAFIQEARHMAKIRHRHVLAIHGAGIDQGRPGFWCDFIEGRALSNHQPTPFNTLLSICIQSCQAIQAVHQAGIIHGDIKPSNMMVDNENQLVLMDFGAGLESNKPNDINHWIGSPVLMAPELFKNNKKTTATDIYALGCTIYYLATGQFPHQTDDIVKLQQLHKQPVKINHTHWPKPFSIWLEQTLSNTPNNRPSANNSLVQLNAIREAPRKKRIKRLILTTFIALLTGTTASLWGMLVAQKERQAATHAAEQAQATSDFLTDVLASSFVTGSGRDVRVTDLLKQAADNNNTQMQERPHVQATVNEAIGMSYLNLRMADESRRLLEAALTHHQNETTKPAKKIMDLQLSLSKSWLISDNKEKANTLIEQVLIASEGHPDLQEVFQLALIYKAGILTHTNQLDIAESLLQQALAIETQNINNHKYLAQNALTSIHIDRSDFTQALESNHKALKLLKQHSKAKTINILVNQLQKATIFASSGQYAEAEDIYHKNLYALETLLGQNNDRYARTLVNYGGALQAQNKLEQALPILEQAHKSLKVLHGETSISALIAAMNLANTLNSLDFKDQAEQLMRQTLAMFTTHHPQNPNRYIMVYNLTELLNQKHQFQTSHEMLTAQLPEATQSMGESHLVTLLTKDNLAISLSGQGQCTAAKALHQALIQSMIDKFTIKSPHTHTVIHNHIDALLRCNESKDASQVANEWHQNSSQALGEEHALTQALLSKAKP